MRDVLDPRRETPPMTAEPLALAATKFIPPQVPAGHIARPRLTDALNAGVGGALTLLAAPAGAGKSALLSAWVRERGSAPTAWLSLDADDGDRRRFWRGMLEALQRAGIGEPLASLAVHPEDGPDLILPALVNALDAMTEPVVLVIDDLHEIGMSGAVRDLDQLLRRPAAACASWPPPARTRRSARVACGSPGS